MQSVRQGNEKLNADGKHPLVSIVIPTYNRSEDLKLCLDSLLKQTFTNYEILVVDNGSTDDTPQILKNYKVKVIRDETKNLAYLFNLGTRNVSGSILAYINDDAEADSHWLESIVKTFEKFKNVSMVGGPTIATKEQEIFKTFDLAQKSHLLGIAARIYNAVICEGKLFDVGRVFQSGAYSIGGSLAQSLKLNHPIDVDFLSIIGVAVRKEVFCKLDGFDENFIWVHEDGDLFIRAKRLGHKLVFNPKVVVWHHINPGGATRGAYNLGRDQAYFFFKDFRPTSLSGFVRLLLNIFFFNFFWVYKMIQLKNVEHVKGVLGFISGVRDYFQTRAREPLNAR